MVIALVVMREDKHTIIPVVYNEIFDHFGENNYDT